MFAFRDPEDAYRWAFKQNWDFKQDVAIVKIKGKDQWHLDPSEDIHLKMGKGEAVRSMERVKPEDIVGSVEFEDFKNPSELDISPAEFMDRVVGMLEEGQAMSKADGSIDISDSPWKKQAKKELQRWKEFSQGVVSDDQDPEGQKEYWGAPRLSAIRKLAAMKIDGDTIPAETVKAYKKVKGFVVSSAGLENMFISRVIR